MSPKQSSGLLEQFRVTPSQNFSSESKAEVAEPYNLNFSKTDASAMSSAYKNGSLDFGDLKSGTSAYGSNKMSSPGMESEKAKQTSPRSPVGRKDKKAEAQLARDQLLNKPQPDSNSKSG